MLLNKFGIATVYNSYVVLEVLFVTADQNICLLFKEFHYTIVVIIPCYDCTTLI